MFIGRFLWSLVWGGIVLCWLGAGSLSVSLAQTIAFQDRNDISIYQANSILSRPPVEFDLNKRALLFTPSGNGYLIANQAAVYESALGTKLNLTTAPAVNPKPSAEPGDDAYLLQDIGFNFPFYGTNYGAVAIASNGVLTLRSNSTPLSGTAKDVFDVSTVASTETLVELRSGPPRLAPYWHDLDARASAVTGESGIYLRREANRIIVTWHNVRDFPSDLTRDKGVQRFQATLFRDGRILFAYDQIQLTSKAMVGLSPGYSVTTPSLLNLSNGASNVNTSALAEFFTLTPGIDEFSVARTFYATHPNRDVYDFLFVMTDFNHDLSGAQASYFPIRNDARGLGLEPFDNDPNANLGARRLQGIISLSNIAALYPDSPVTRFLGAQHSLGLLTQQTGQRWLANVRFPGTDPRLLNGRDERYWSTFFHTPSSVNYPAARRASVMEGNVWADAGDGSFISEGLPDGFSTLDQYLMGLRPANQVGDSFVIGAPSSEEQWNKATSARPGLRVKGTRVPVTISQIIAANGVRTPDHTTSRKNFRAAFILITQNGTESSPAVLAKITRLRLAFESYFAQATDYLATMSTGVADETASRTIAAVSAASFEKCVAPGEIAALFGTGLAAGTVSATAQPLPTTLGGVTVLVNGIAAPLYFVSANQINYQMPRTLTATTLSPGHPSATALVEVYREGQLVRAGAVQIAPVSPAIFTLNRNGTGAAVALDAIRYTLAPFDAQRTGGQPNIIALYGTGLGADATDTTTNVATTVRATFTDSAGTPRAGAVLYAGRAPGFAGLNQLNLQFPANLPSGIQTLVVTRNGIPSAPVTVAIR